MVFSKTTTEYYKSIVERYISSLSEKNAHRVRCIEKAADTYLYNIYGYSPSASEITWPVLEPNFIITEAPLIPFNVGFSRGITDGIVHFFIDDEQFMRVFRNPDNYIDYLRNCKGVIGPDMSQYTDMPSEMRCRHALCNVSLSSYFQKNGVNIYPNVTWSKGDSFWYSFPDNLKDSVIAINSNGIHKSTLSLYRWRRGYERVIEVLSPKHIIRYGRKVNGELTDISSYFINERLITLQNGSKRK